MDKSFIKTLVCALFCAFAIFLALLEGISFFVLYNEKVSEQLEKNRPAPKIADCFKNKYSHLLKFWKGEKRRKYFYIDTSDKKSINLNYPNLPILIFSSGYTGGTGLGDREDIAYYLSEIAKSPVYKRVLFGTSAQHMLYQLEQKEFYEKFPKPKQVIFFYINLHMKRLYLYSQFSINQRPAIMYKKKKALLARNHLKEALFSSSFAQLLYKRKYKDEYFSNPTQENVDFLIMHYKQAKKESEKYWGNDVEYALVLFGAPHSTDYIKPSLKELEKEGFDVIDINDLTGENFYESKYQKGWYPNEKTWQKIAPLIAKRLGLNP